MHILILICFYGLKATPNTAAFLTPKNNAFLIPKDCCIFKTLDPVMVGQFLNSKYTMCTKCIQAMLNRIRY